MTKRSYTKIIDRQAVLDELLELAESGAPRPRQLDGLLGKMLSNSTCRTSTYYDPSFDKEVRSVRPDWFTKGPHQSEENKRKLLAMARKGKMRPCGSTSLGNAITHYVSETSGAYDAEFRSLLREVAPEWFIDTRKAQFVEDVRHHADEGLSPPKGWHRLVRKGSQYDEETAAYLRANRPEWFSTTERLKSELVRHAIEGTGKPSIKTTGRSLYYAMRRYALPGDQYDEDFTTLLKSLRPDWFIGFRKAAPRKKRT